MTKVRKFAGWALLVGVGGLMLFAGTGKAFGFAPPDVFEGMKKYGLLEQARLIGAGEAIAALLLLLPRTSSLGLLLTSGFWGGAICIHMAFAEPYLPQAGLLVATWIGATLRDTRTLASFVEPRGT
ncbi:MAG TPA: DoxX family protein [Gemmatales bacterium]|nr:DoxX family protein [Gemmatales bacterium]HMP58769.1 DoxX family protein [Gemmatales bacterium]